MRYIIPTHISNSVCVCVCVCVRTRACTQLCHVQLFAIPWTIQPTLVFCLWNFPGKKTVMGCHFLLQGSFPTKESNPCILCLFHWQANSLPLAPSGKMVSSNMCCQLHKEVVTLYCLMKIQGSKLYMWFQLYKKCIIKSQISSTYDWWDFRFLHLYTFLYGLVFYKEYI